MSIESIVESTWPEIMQVQADAYSQVEPESLDVLKSKWLRSPESCFVYREEGKVIGYVLAHSWSSDLPPKLYHPLPGGTEGATLFIHDLAMSKEAAGKGLGSRMISHLFRAIEPLGYRQARLVAVQASGRFWNKQGFSAVNDQAVCASYGDGAQLMRRPLSA